MYLLDTNVVSELRRIQRADPQVAEWSRAVDVSDMYLSVITLQELELGTLLMERRDSIQGAALRTWTKTIITRFKGRFLNVDRLVAVRCAQLQVPDPKPYYDALIAATALVHNMTLVTRNVADFEKTGVRILNPWTGQS
jgi:predicted nucleic acid-binding protein